MTNVEFKDVDGTLLRIIKGDIRNTWILYRVATPTEPVKVYTLLRARSMPRAEDAQFVLKQLRQDIRKAFNPGVQV